MTTPDGKYRWSMPPGWPAPPEGWTPPPGWKPDPMWPPAPDGWQFWEPVQVEPSVVPAWGQPTALAAAPSPAAADAGSAPPQVETPTAWGAGGITPAGRTPPAGNWVMRHKALSVIGALLVVGLIGSAFSDDPTGPVASTSGQQASRDEQPDEDEPAPPTVQTPEEELAEKVRESLSRGNRDGVQRVSAVTLANGDAHVQFAINDNLTEGLIRTSARIDVGKIIQAAKDVGNVQQLNVVGTFSMSNNLGETSETVVVDVTYSAAIIRRINVDAAPRDTLLEVADVKSFVHPAFQQD